MGHAHADRLMRWLNGHQREMRGLLELLAEAESPSSDAAAQRRPFALLASELRRAGFVVRRVRGHGVGDHLYARPREREPRAPVQLLVGHMDTVWPQGTLARMPIEVADGELHGPGVFDMKGGLVQLVFALRALHALRLDPTVAPVVFVNTDEEIGSRDSGRWLGRLARIAERAFVLECPEGASGRLKTARKGVGRFELIVHGVAAHAGGSFEEGVSAVLELSHQIQRLFALNDPERGLTVNVGTIDGGLRPNVVAPQARALIDVRAPTAAAALELGRALRALTPVLPGASLELHGGFGRQPMEPLPRNRRLFARARTLGTELGLELEEAKLAGGASDANTTSLHTATLDGLGAVGAGAHALHEHVLLEQLPERAALLALLLLEPARARQLSERSTSRRRRAGASPRPPLVALLGSPLHETNEQIAGAWRALGVLARVVDPLDARHLRLDDVVLGRLDVLPTLDGVEPGLLELLWLERRGVRVLNPVAALLAAHDKLRTTRLLAAAGLPQPRSVHLPPRAPLPAFPLPLVVKPRFGSWGADVLRCESAEALAQVLAALHERPWFRRHGALLQELVPSSGWDLRLVVAGGQLVGAVERVAKPGEWRTNISLGGTKRAADPPRDARALAVVAAAAIGADLVGVDLLPLAGGGYTILELNGSVDFSAAYSLGRDVYRAAAEALGLLAGAALAEVAA